VLNDMEGSLPTVRIDLKPEEASRPGVTKAVLSANLATLFDGLPVTTVWEKDYPLQVTLKIDRATTPQSVHDSVASYKGLDFDQLQNTLVPTAVPGVWVPLRQVATISPDLTLTRSTITRQWDDKFNFYPIPQTELKQNPNLTQNPGW
jgi:multidrug efflux pump subunit AcrB